MTTASPVGCARCGTILGDAFRFCPECGLPVSGGSVLSTEIEELRRRVEADAVAARDAGWRRYLLPVAATAMFVFVVVLGLVLFNTKLLNRLLPENAGARPVAVLPATPRWEPLWIDVPAGRFSYDAERRDAEIPYAFKISKFEVSSGLWLEFLRSERRRLADLWQEAFPKIVEGWSEDAHGEVRLAPDWRRQYPVTGVSPVAIAEFCAWLTRRLNRAGWEVRIPTRLEWEYAARGRDGRTFAWGNDFPVRVPHSGSVRTRVGVGSVCPLDDTRLVEDDTSAFGVVGMGANVSEWTLMLGMNQRSLDKPDEPDREDFAALPWGAGLREALEQKEIEVALRGASYLSEFRTANDPGPDFPRAWDYKPFGPEVRAAEVAAGIRLVMVKLPK